MAKPTQSKAPVPGSTGTQITKEVGVDALGPDYAEVEEGTAGAISEPSGDTPPNPPIRATPSDNIASESPSAAPASVAAPAPKIETLQKRSPKDGALRLVPPIPNKYSGRDAERMVEEVPSYCMKSAVLRIGLNKWDFQEKQTYILPRWFCLSHPRVFVIKGD